MSISFSTNWWNRVRYTLWAPIYDAVAGVFGRPRKKALELAEIQSGERVLLLGAGTGLDLPYLPRDCSITAIDITPAMVDRLRLRAQGLGLSVDARVMDGHALDFPSASFDLVVLHLILAVIPDPRRCMCEAARVLRPGGRVVILDKFIPDGHKTPLLIRLLQPLASLIGTELNRQLGPLLLAGGLTPVHSKSVSLGGYFRIVVARTAAAEP